MANTITAFHTFTPNTKAKSAEVNTNFSNFRGDLVPINTDTASASNATHDLGTSDHKWRKIHAESGYWTVGDVKYHHTYNGLCPIGEGWFICDGSTINSTNYDAQHSTGSWTTFIGSSPLQNLVSPNNLNRYMYGITATTDGGTSTISTIGNTGSVADISHQHTIPSHLHNHNHIWHLFTTGTTGANHGSATSYDSNGNSQQVHYGLTTGSGGLSIDPGINATVLDITSYTNKSTASGGETTSSIGGNASQDIKPDSIGYIPLIRII